ncbi:MAG: V-type ATPase 116kDa subunit family protein, partial [Acidilobaceae archaeon]
TFLGVVDAYLKREYEELVAVKVPKFLFFTAVTLPFLVYFDVSKAGSTLRAAILELGGGDPMATLILALGVIAIAWIFLGEPVINAIHGHSPLSGLTRGFMEAYESILMAIGNIPSFLRIMALAMAHSSIMLGFAFILKTMAHAGLIGLILGLAVYVIGNLLVVGLEGILAFAHTLRLHFYEWFSKFYIAGGTPFTPIALPEVRIIYIGKT